MSLKNVKKTIDDLYLNAVRRMIWCVWFALGNDLISSMAKDER
jgi:hypothetical protein